MFGKTNETCQLSINQPTTDALLNLINGFLLSVTCRGNIVVISPSIEQHLGHCQVSPVMKCRIARISYLFYCSGVALRARMLVYSLVDCVFAHLQHDRLKWQNDTILMLLQSNLDSNPIHVQSLANIHHSNRCEAGNKYFVNCIVHDE